jgi:putative transposase
LPERNTRLWRAVDQDGHILDEPGATPSRAAIADAAVEKGSTAKRIITDKLRSYSAAKRLVLADVEHRSNKGLTNRAENSHGPLRNKRAMQSFRPKGSLQCIVSSQKSLRSATLSSALSITSTSTSTSTSTA